VDKVRLFMLLFFVVMIFFLFYVCVQKRYVFEGSSVEFCESPVFCPGGQRLVLGEVCHARVYEIVFGLKKSLNRGELVESFFDFVG